MSILEQGVKLALCCVFCGRLSRAPTVLFTTVLLFPVAGLSGGLSVAKIAGYYSTPSRYCTEIEEGKIKPCEPSSTDWLRIEEVDNRHASFHVYSVQGNGDQCEANGVAEWDGRNLVYKESDRKSEDFGHGFRIEFKGKKITFSYLPPPGPLEPLPPFCGARANLERVEFSLS